MKSFYTACRTDAVAFAAAGHADSDAPVLVQETKCSYARVAIYEALGATPRVEDIEPGPVPEFIESFTARIYQLAREQGGSIPYTAIREVTENFIHADFAEPVVSILDSGMTIRFADQGPGIADKDRAVMPGFTTAHGDMKHYIRGVGSGLPIVRDYLSFSGGSLAIEDNLGGGSVVTLYASGPRGNPRSGMLAGAAAQSSSPSLLDREDPNGDSGYPPGRQRLSTRQKHVLALVMESGIAGPSLVAKELAVGVSTAYRDLASLEDMGLISSEGGKRTLTEQGLACFDRLVTR